MKTKTFVLALCATLGLGGCDMEVPDLNNPSIDVLEKNPTPAAVNSAATGLLLGHRLGKNTQNGYVALLGVLGREAYVLDPGDGRYVTEMLSSPSLDPGSPAFGGNFWTGPYANIRNAHILLRAVESVPNMTEASKEGIRGFAKTMMALEFLHLYNTRYTNGVVLDVDRPLSEPLAPIVTDPAVVLAHINTLLDAGKTHLQAGGATFSFPLGSGFEGFDTPATFLRFNRALKARVEVYAGHYDEALTALEESFLDETGSMDLGVYNAYGTGSGDTTNDLRDQDILVHPSVVTEAERKTNGTLDERVIRKVEQLDEPSTLQGLTSSYGFTMYKKPTAPIPIIRNEELLLLRAEANMKRENLFPAERDINIVRTRSGGLPTVLLNTDTIEDELLKQRRYSLLFEGGHRWIDMRRFGRLSELPRDRAGDVVHTAFPVPTAEIDARQ
jgi:hypothetical protein